MRKSFVLGIDPSGSYEEGMGTTGICTFNCIENKFNYTGYICAENYRSQAEYFQAHLDWLQNTTSRAFKGHPIIAMEDYLLYANQAASQTNSRMETCQLIGIIKQWAYQNKIPVILTPAALTKKRLSNEILESTGYLVLKEGKYYSKIKEKKYLKTHELDAMRQAIYYYKFHYTPVGQQAEVILPDYQKILQEFMMSPDTIREFPLDPRCNYQDNKIKIMFYIDRNHLNIRLLDKGGKLYGCK